MAVLSAQYAVTTTPVKIVSADVAAQLAATNAKLEALGLTAQDIGTLLNAAKG